MQRDFSASFLFDLYLFVDISQPVCHEVLQDEAEDNVERKGEPKCIIPDKWMEGVVDSKIGNGREEH